MDLGVEAEASKTPEALALSLGFTLNHLPLLFKSHRHKSGLNSWDPMNDELFIPAAASHNADMEPISLHWHQLAGVHAIVRNNFSDQPESILPCGALVADEVGLGKTFQAATVIAFLADVVMRQKLGKPLPPIIVKSPYLGTCNPLPELPHLIVVPGTLLSQWEGELKTVFKRGTVDILVYGTRKAARERFWAPDGPFHASKHVSNKIIIASHSVSRDIVATFSVADRLL